MWLTGCSDLDQDEVRRIALIELGAEGPARVDIECKSDRLELSASYRDRTARKSVSLSAVEASSRPRLVALSAAELVHELERLAGLPPKPPAARALPKPRRRPARFAFSLGPMLVAPTRGQLYAPGAQLLAQGLFFTHVTLGLGFEGSQASRAIAGGTLVWRSGSVLATSRLHGEFGRYSLFGELALLGSLDQLTGAPKTKKKKGESFHSFSMATRLGFGLEVAFGRHGVVALSIGMMRKSHGLYARNQGASGVAIGPWMATSALGLGARW